MLRPFNHFRKPRLAPRGSIETIFGMIVTQAREPLFYLDRFYLDLLYLELLYLALLYLALGVPDTVSGRFDLPVLQLWMVSRRLRLMTGEIGPAQGPFDHVARIWTAICGKWVSGISLCRGACRHSARPFMAVLRLTTLL